jgi:uncharacterized protein GlcG (DUF336 family)
MPGHVRRHFSGCIIKRNIDEFGSQSSANFVGGCRLGCCGGNLMSFLRMSGAFIHSFDIAIDKAYTAASFGFPTKDWMAAIGHDDGMKLGFSAQPRLIVFGGGLPIRAAADGGEWCGGIGVSGASEAQDEECARAGLAAIGLAG